MSQRRSGLRLRVLAVLIGAGLLCAAVLAIALVGEKVLRKETMGWGDVWLLSGIGAWLGWQALLPVVLFSAIQGSMVGAILLFLGRGPAERARFERAAREIDARERSAQHAEAAGGGPAASWYSSHSPPSQPQHDPDEEDWVPPPHAVPFGPFLALAALEVLLAGDALYRWYFDALERFFG